MRENTDFAFFSRHDKSVSLILEPELFWANMNDDENICSCLCGDELPRSFLRPHHRPTHLPQSVQPPVQRRVLLRLAFHHGGELLLLRGHVAQLLVALEGAPPHRLDLCEGRGPSEWLDGSDGEMVRWSSVL